MKQSMGLEQQSQPGFLKEINTSMTPLRLSLGYYVLGVAVLSIFTLRVCQECAVLETWQILSMFIISFVLVGLIKVLLEPHLLAATPILESARAQFVFDILLYTFVGGAITWYNSISFEMSTDTGIQIMIGCLSFGAFASLDNALCRERQNILEGKFRLQTENHYVPTSKRLFLAFSFIIAFTCLIMALIFINQFDYTLRSLNSVDIIEIKQTIMFNTAFVVTIILLLSLQVIRSYSGNLKLLFDYQLKALKAVEEGDYTQHVPIVTQDEFSLIAEKTNQMIDGLQRAASEEDDFFDMSMTVSNEVKLFPLLAKIADISKKFLDADRCTLFLYDGKTDELWCMVGEGIEDRDIRFSAKEGIAGHVFQSRSTLNIPDAYSDARFNQAIDKLTGYCTTTILGIPIIDKESNCLGVIQAINKHDGIFTARDEKRLRMFSGQAAIAISNAQLFEDINAMKNYNESILKSLNDGVITLDDNDTIVKANLAALRILGEEDFIVGHAANDLFDKQNSWVLKNLHQTVQQNKAVLSMDANLALRNGEQAAVNLNTVPLVDLENKHIGSMMIIEDITNEKRMRSTMSRYMTEEVAERLLSGDDNVLGGNAQDVSVLFSDIRGFTTLSESIGARETVTMLNEYFSYMADAVFQHNGILDKYIGDAIMAVFGAPFKSEHDADNSVNTAIEMMRSLNKFNHNQLDKGVMPLEIGIGISSGEVVSGNIGSPKRMDYTVIGDTVNLASRLEGTTKFYSCPIMICAVTHASLKDTYVSREIDSIRVKGKDRPIVVYEILDYHTADSFPQMHEAIACYNEGVIAYKNRQWERAMKFFTGCIDIKPSDGPSKIYLQRCEYFLQHPPTHNWDGVWTMEVK